MSHFKRNTVSAIGVFVDQALVGVVFVLYLLGSVQGIACGEIIVLERVVRLGLVLNFEL